ncbi:MAG: phosphoribosylaminoimidazolesuccinocarboxamide synthase [Clostridia bacterium]
MDGQYDGDKITVLKYEGKDKRIWECENPRHLILEYKDLAITESGTKVGIIPNKGIYINKINNHLFQYLEENGVQTHFVRELNDRETVVKKVDIIPIEIIVRNVAAGTLVQRLGLAEGTKLNSPVIEYYFKRPDMQNPMINASHIFAMDLCTPKDLDIMEYNAFRINKILSHYLSAQNITLVDFKVEFGKSQNRILLADEISPDTCRFWDSVTGEKLDKDRFRQDLGNVSQAYEEICRRLLNM